MHQNCIYSCDYYFAVYLYQEVLQLLRKECCDVCCLQGERVEGSKYVLAYTSVDHPKVPVVENVLRGKVRCAVLQQRLVGLLISFAACVVL